MNGVVVKCEKTIIMEIHSGDKDVDEDCDVIDYWTPFFDDTVLINIFIMSDMVKKGYKVFIKTDIKITFIVTNTNIWKVTNFPCDVRGCYVREASESMVPIDCCMHNFDVTHFEGFTLLEARHATSVMKLYHDVHAPPIPSLKVWLRQNMAKMCRSPTKMLAFLRKYSKQMSRLVNGRQSLPGILY